MKTKKFSHQRELILRCLDEHNTHLTVEEIFNETKKIKSDISLATIYRNLNQLEETGKVSKIKAPDNLARYELNKGPHHHFICSQCGKIEDLPHPSIKSCQTCISDKSNFTVEKIISTVIGRCADCN